MPADDYIIIAGDLNGHVDEKADGNRCHGGKGFGARNEVGERIIDFADTHDLVLMNTWFIKRLSHLPTFYSRNSKTQIDHILIRRRHFTTVTDCKTVPYRTIAPQHRPLIDVLRIRNIGGFVEVLDSTWRALRGVTMLPIIRAPSHKNYSIWNNLIATNTAGLHLDKDVEGVVIRSPNIREKTEFRSTKGRLLNAINKSKDCSCKDPANEVDRNPSELGNKLAHAMPNRWTTLYEHYPINNPYGLMTTA